MAEQDSLSGFDFDSVSKPGKFLKFQAGKPVTVRVLTKDPVVQERVFEGDGETNISTKFCFIVWNFTDEKAQIMSVGPSIGKTLQSVAKDEDFGANLQKCDIKISPEGEGKARVYTVNVLRHSGNEKSLTQAMIDEAKLINLDTDVKDNKGRLSEFTPSTKKPEPAPAPQPTVKPKEEDVVIEDIGDEPINLDDIPF